MVLFRWKFFIWRKKRRATISAIIVAFRKHFSHEVAYSIAHFAFLGDMHTPYHWHGGKQKHGDGETLDPVCELLHWMLARSEESSPDIWGY